MSRLLSRLFNVRPGEWPRLLLLYLINLVLLIGIYWGEEIIEAGFLHQVGVQYLPQLMMINALGAVLAIILYGAFADRVANDRLLIVILGLGVVGIGGGVVLWKFRLAAVAYGLLYLTLQIPLRTILNVHWATFVNSFYDIRAAKRLLPTLGSAVRLAGVISGLTMPVLNRFLSPPGIVLVWLGAILVTVMLIGLMPRLIRDSAISVAAPQRTRWAEHIREGHRYVLGSPFLRWLALTTMLMVVLLQFVDYQSKAVLGRLDSIQEISNLTGALRGWSNLVALPFQLFFLGRLINRIGLGNTSLIFPLGTGLTSLGLILAPGLPTALGGQLARTTLRTTFRNPVDSLLYNAVPLRVKGRARAFIGGALVPVGEFVGGLLLLVLQTVSPTVWFSPAVFAAVVLGALALGHLFGAWRVRQLYTHALVEMLERQDFSSLVTGEVTALTVADPETLRLLQERLEQTDNTPELTILIAQLIARIGGVQAIAILDVAARRAQDPYLRASLVDVLVAAEADDARARRLYADLLSDPDRRVRRSALSGLERFDDPRLTALALTLLDDPDPEMRVRALTVLARTSDFYGHPTAFETLEALLESTDAEQRAHGVRVLHTLSNHDRHLRTVDRLLDYLDDPADEVRLQAVLAVENLVTAMSGRVNADAVAYLVDDPVERIRQGAVTILGAIGTPTAYQVMLTALNDSARSVRMAAVDHLAHAGASVLSLLEPLTNARSSHLAGIAAMSLCRIDRRRYLPLLRRQIEHALDDAYHICAYLAALEEAGQIGGLDALRSALSEQKNWLFDQVFDLLGTLYDDVDLRVVSVGLRSEDAHTRANAVEAFESLTWSQAMHHLMRPIVLLLDPQVTPGEQASLARELWGIEPPNLRRLFETLILHPEPFVNPTARSIAVISLAEIGATMDALRPDFRAWGRAQPDPAVDAMFGHLRDVPSPDPDSSAVTMPLDRAMIEAWIDHACADAAPTVRMAALAARDILDGLSIIARARKEGFMLSTVEKMMALKKVPFFQNMTVEQLTVVANVCEEVLVEASARIFEQGEAGGALYVVVSGRVAIERAGRRRGSSVRLAEIEANSYFGEMSLFDGAPRSASAVAIRDSLLLRLRREPLLALLRRYPDLSLELIQVLSQRLRDANERIAGLSQSRPQELQKLYDKLG